jgi:cytochrome c-type biogenesis protein CcmE
MDVINPGSGSTPGPHPTEGLDLTPRTAEAGGGRPRRSGGRRRGPILVLVLVVAGVGYVAAQALGTATTFFYNADEAVAQQPKLGTTRFRMQGTVEPGTIQRDGSAVAFKISFNGAEVAVVHQGDPPELFKDAEPVVLEGHWDTNGTRFDSDRMLIKHDANYVAKNSGRLKQADDGGTVAPTVTLSTAP